MTITIRDRQRFLSKVDQTGTCWTYHGHHDKDGYGRFWHAGRTVGAHYFSAVLHGLVIPPGYMVCHHCDNPGVISDHHPAMATHDLDQHCHPQGDQ
jgi:hypothetical protein